MMASDSHSTSKVSKGNNGISGLDIKEEIIKVLSRFKEGKTINEIADILNLNRQTVSKYVLVLIETNFIGQREVGRAKLCYLKKVKK